MLKYLAAFDGIGKEYFLNGIESKQFTTLYRILSNGYIYLIAIVVSICIIIPNDIVSGFSEYLISKFPTHKYVTDAQTLRQVGDQHHIGIYLVVNYFIFFTLPFYASISWAVIFRGGLRFRTSNIKPMGLRIMLLLFFIILAFYAVYFFSYDPESGCLYCKRVPNGALKFMFITVIASQAFVGLGSVTALYWSRTVH